MSEIPNYPQFIALNFSHKRFFEQLFKKYPPQISEFTFTNLFSWKEAYNYKVSLLNGQLILRSDSGEGVRFLQPIGALDPTEVMERVLGDTKRIFIRIPEEIVGFFMKSSRFLVEEDINNWDYVYLSSDLIDLPGRKYDGKRNLIKKFKFEYSDYVYSDINAPDAALILGFEEDWCTIKDCDRVEGLNNEREMLRQIVAHFSDFCLKAGAITLEGKIRAVAIAETLNPDTLVMHALKADPSVPGLYQTMLNGFLRAHAKAFKYVNLEQDLGIAGLRASKQSYHPVRMIKKYTVSLKP